MNTQTSYFLKFKDQIVDAVINHSLKLFKPFIGVYLIYSLIAVVVLLPIILFIMPPEIIEIFQDIALNGKQPDPFLFEDLDPNIFLDRLPQVISGAVLLLGLALILTSWHYNWAFKVSKSMIEEGKPNLQATLKASFDGGMWRILGLSLLIVLIYLGGVLILALSAALLPVLAFILFIPVIMLLLRYILAYPATVTAEMPIMEAMRFSWSHISWGRAGKLLLVGIVFMVVLILLSLLSTLITTLAGAGVIASVLNILIQVITGTLVLAFTIAGLNGLFYRYGEFELESEQAEGDHLID
jgi:hypothetical protein